MWSISTRDLPTLPTIVAAEKFFLGTKQPRSYKWDVNERPLRGTRDTHMKLIRGMDIEGKTMYRAELYGTTMVAWYIDGRVTIRQHSSQSSARFVHRVSPFGAYVRGDRLWVVAHDGQHYTMDHTLTVHPNNTVEGAKQMFKKRVNREITGAMRRSLKDFVTYFKMRLALGDCSIEPRLARTYRENLVSGMLAAPTNQDLWHKAYLEFEDLADFWKVAYEFTPDAYYNEPIPLGACPY